MGFISLPQDLIQYLCLYLKIKDVMSMLTVNKWSNAMFSNPYIWKKLAQRINAIFQSVEIPILKFCPALYNRVALHFPSHWTIERKKEHILYLSQEYACGNWEGQLLTILGACSKFLCIGTEYKTPFDGSVKRVKNYPLVDPWTNGRFELKPVLFTMGNNSSFSNVNNTIFQDPIIYVDLDNNIYIHNGWLERLLKEYHEMINLV